jgi:D-psicose/D-tagatose/L-ribulose 3-epimerase
MVGARAPSQDQSYRRTPWSRASCEKIARVRLALCNEVLRDLPFAAQCRLAAALGYDGLELAPFTVSETPDRLDAGSRAELRRIASDAGLEIIGLHWLLVAPEGLSITSADAAVRQRTVDVIRGLVTLCADLGGRIIVHGSPGQRRVAAGDDPKAAWQRARDVLAAVAGDVERAGVTYCIEPLARTTTNFVNTVAEAAELARAVGRPAFRTMIDTGAATAAEETAIPELIDRWMPTGAIAHVQLNDTNARGPGQGTIAFAPILDALERHGYRGVVSMEPFDYHPDGPTCAARMIGYVRGLLEARGFGPPSGTMRTSSPAQRHTGGA